MSIMNIRHNSYTSQFKKITYNAIILIIMKEVQQYQRQRIIQTHRSNEEDREDVNNWRPPYGFQQKEKPVPFSQQ